MSSDLNSLIANYLSENPTANTSDIVSRLRNLGDEYSTNLINYTSIFSYGDTADESELLDYFSAALEEDADTISEDVSLLFNILDQDSSGSLSDDELEILNREFGRNRGKIDGFSFFNDLISIDESEVQEILDSINDDAASLALVSSSKSTASSSTSPTESTSSSTSKSSGLSDDSRIKTDSDGNNYILVEKWVSNDSSRNSCLYYIIKHSYDFDELGVSYSSAKDKLLSAIVDANNISNANLIYTNQKIILPDAYEVLGIDNS